MVLEEIRQESVKSLAEKPKTRYLKVPRKRHTLEKKLQVVSETFAPGASVSIVARRHDLNTNLVFSWLRQFENGGLVGPDKRELKREMQKFVAVGLLPKPGVPGARQELPGCSACKACVAGTVEIENGSGVKVRLSGSVDEKLLSLVLAEIRKLPS
jgi:transposase